MDRAHTPKQKKKGLLGFNEVIKEGKATLSGFSLSNSFGYMIWDWLAVYGGGQVIYIFADYKVKDNEKKTTMKTDDHLWGYGPFAGIQLNTTGPYWKIIFAVEGNATNIPIATGWYKGNKRQWAPGWAGYLGVLLKL